MTVFRRSLIDARRSFQWWVVGMVALVTFTAVFYPSVRGQEEFDELMQDLPEAIRNLVGVQEGIPLTSPAGYLHARLFSIMLPVLLLTYGIALGTRATAGSEADGTLELLLANPVTRRSILRQRYLGMVVLLGAVTVSAAATLALLAPAFHLLDGVRATRLAAAMVTAVCLVLLHATMAFTAGALSGRPGVATAVATSVAAAGYLIQGIAAANGSLGAFEDLSPWRWYLERNVVAQGAPAVAVLGPLLLSAVLYVVAERGFARRDLR